jgi:ABC-2 type transport system permease protein
MRSIYAVYRKEMGHYFVSPVAYVVVTLFIFFSALLFVVALRDAVAQSFEVPSGFDASSALLRNSLGLLTSFSLFMVPMITMGLFAEERKRGTIELLMTSPIREADLVLGKFLASLSLFAVMLLPTATSVVYVWLHADPRPQLRILLAGYLGILLFGGCLLALGVFVSSLTENQIVASALTWGIFVFFWIIGWVVDRFGPGGATGMLAGAVQYLSVTDHFEDFTRGVVDTSHVVYYLSFIGFFIFLTVRSIDSLRWRRA